MATKIVEWDDFTGGYYVGASATKQPRNTFTGQNVTVAMDDATLVPMYTPTKRTLTGTDTSGGNIVNANWANLGPPAIINGCVCFVATTASAAYLYVINANSVVTRHTLTVVSVANFVPLRPTAVSVSSSTSDFFVYIAGDYQRLIRLRLDTTGTCRVRHQHLDPKHGGDRRHPGVWHRHLGCPHGCLVHNGKHPLLQRC
jgi:hypothetical protein